MVLGRESVSSAVFKQALSNYIESPAVQQLLMEMQVSAAGHSDYKLA